MGNQLATSSVFDLNLQDLGEGLAQDKILGTGRLLKSVQCWTEEGLPVVVKVYLKKDDDNSTTLSPYYEKLKLLVAKLELASQPNVLSYHRAVETDKAGYLVRQYCYSNLADRISTRPFFSDTGKRWIMYQILKGLEQMHSIGIFHGDLKAENVVLTGWDWVFITDLAPFKPIRIPADDPGRFSYFFDTAERRICLLAPERFTDPSSAKLTPEETVQAPSSQVSTPETAQAAPTSERLDKSLESMDIFGAGCILAQLFLDGEALFVYHQLLEYRKGLTEHLNASLNRISDPDVRELLAHMLQPEAPKRFSAKEYIDNWKTKVFPDYFELLHNVLAKMVVQDCDQRIVSITRIINPLMDILQLIEDGESMSNIPEQHLQQLYSLLASQTPLPATPNEASELAQQKEKYDQQPARNSILPKTVGNKQDLFKVSGKSSKPMNKLPKATEVIAAVLCSSIRNARSVSNRVRGLCLMEKLANCASDYTLLQRFVPYTCVLLGDTAPIVKSTALRTLTTVLSKITSFPASEANLYNDYILPTLKTLASDQSELVRMTLAEILPVLAYQSRLYLEMGQIINQKIKRGAIEESTPMVKGTFDTDLGALQDEFNSIISQISMDECAYVKRAFMKNIIQLFMFYGGRKADGFVLPTAISFLNARDWRLRHAFFKQIVGISVYVGKTSLKEFILPLIINALYDVEEFVVEEALTAVVSLCELMMFTKQTIIQLAKKIAPLLHHPNTWLRYDAIAFFATASKQLGTVDTTCFLLDILKPHLDYSNLVVSQYSLLESVKPPIDRNLFNSALNAPIEAFQQAQNESSTTIASATKFWENLTGMQGKISSEDVEKLTLMKNYIEQAAKALQISRMWDMGEDSESREFDVIKLPPTVPSKTHAVAVDTEAGVSSYKLNNTQVEYNALKSTGKRSIKKSPANSQSAASNGSSQTSTTVNYAGELPMLTGTDISRFRPTGHIFGQSNEHKGSINEIAVHDSLSWFATGGNDMTVKIWDLRNADREIAMISKMTFAIPRCSAAEERITSLSVLCNSPQTSSIIAAATDRGMVHFMSPDVETSTIYSLGILEDGTVQHRKSEEDTTTTKLQQQTSIGAIRPFMVKNTPVLLCGNRSGRVSVLDVRMGKQAFIWKSDESVQQGPITAICGDEYWMLSGTRRGFLTLWDLRFQIPVLSWRMSNRAINSLGVYKPTISTRISSSPLIYIGTGSNEISLYSFELQQAVRVFQCSDPKAKVTVSTAQKKRAQTATSSALFRKTSLFNMSPQQSASVQQNPLQLQLQQLQQQQADSPTASPRVAPVTTALPLQSEDDPYAVNELEQILWDSPFDTRQSTNFEVKCLHVNPMDGSFYSGSTDRKVRFWDVNNIEKSCIVSGSEMYESSSYKIRSEGGKEVVSEQISQNIEQQNQKKGAFNLPVATYHFDTITDVKVVGTNSPLLVTASRDGVLKMWK